MSTDLPYKAEYAKSNRAACKFCKSKIDKDSLRLAKMVQSPHFDGKIPNWFHYSCFFRKHKVKSTGEIDEFDSLRWDDQEKIRGNVNGATVGELTAKSSTDAVDGPAATAQSDLSVEYAKSSRSTCKGCSETIKKGELRLSKVMEVDATSSAFGKLSHAPWWHHLDCFMKNKDKMNIDAVTADMFTGLTSLSKEDQDKVVQVFGKAKAPKGKGKKRKKAEEEVVVKKQKTADEEEEEKLLKEQSKRLWSIRDELKKNCSNQELKLMLEENDQSINGGEAVLLDRCADGLAFGALQVCHECQGGHMHYSSEGYKCSGNISEWTKCTVITKEPERFNHWTIPKDLKEIPFLKKFKFKPGKRLFPKLTQQPVKGGKAPVGLPLFGMKVAVAGKLSKSKGEVKQLVEKFGGSLVDKVNATVLCVISTPEVVSKEVKNIQTAKSLNIPVVSEDVLDGLKDGDAQSVISKHTLVPWGKPGTSAVDGPPSAAKKSALLAQGEKKIKMMVKGGAAVDPASYLQDVAHVLPCKDGLYCATLGLVDIQRDSNSYYKLQLLEHDNKKKYYVFRSWGRVGTKIGGTKLEDFYDRSDAVESFLSLYEEKTGNDWSERKTAQKNPGKFFPLEIDYGQDDEKVQSALSSKVEPGSRSKLPTEVQTLVKMIFDIQSMKNTMLEFEIDLKKMPLGKLTRRQIEQAYTVLGEAQQLIANNGSANRLLDCSNRFFTLIPHDFGMKKPPLLNNPELIQAKVSMLDNLLEIEVAYSLMKEQHGPEGEDPIDANYHSLKTDLGVLDKKSEEFEMIKKYVKNTHAQTHNTYSLEVREVFKVSRHGEFERFKPFTELHNRQLLWHGSRVTNFAGILSQGLRIAPPEAPSTGYMFGKGIYFADMVSKSANYCCTSPKNNNGLLLLCDVALGNMHELKHADFIKRLPKGKHSVKGLGKTAPNPQQAVTTADGVQVPLGKGVSVKMEGSSLLYNEYIVYDVAQVNIKYLLLTEFQYNGGRLW